MRDEKQSRDQGVGSRQGLEEELRRERAIRICLERCSPCGVLFLDDEKALRTCNPKFLEMMGQPESDFTGKKPPFPFLSFSDQQRLDRLLVEAEKKNGAGAGGELFLKPRYKRCVPVRMAATRVEEDGFSHGWLVFFTDLTDQYLQSNRLAAMVTQMNANW